MATISPEFNVILDYAEAKGFCLYLHVYGESYDGWEDLLWKPSELREVLKDYPEQSRAGQDYPAYNYPEGVINSHMSWKIVDPEDIYEILSLKARESLSDAEAELRFARYFKSVWIDQTENPSQGISTTKVAHEIDDTEV
jgi:hypothetical protein